MDDTGENSSTSNSSPISKDDDEKTTGAISDGNDKEPVVDDQEMTGQLAVLEDSDSKELEKIIYEGLVFESENDAYEQYYLYAQKVGFSVRKEKRYLRADGSVRSRFFVCFKEGQRRKDRRYKYVRKERKERKEREETRTGCKARMAVKNVGNEWICSEIIHEHNHPLTTPSNATQIMPDDKDRKIRELSEELQHEKRLRRACQKRLDQILEDVEEHTQNLSSRIEVAVYNVKKLESEEELQMEDN